MIHRYLVFTVCCFKTRNFEISKQNILKWKAFEKPLLIELRREKSVIDVHEYWMDRPACASTDSDKNYWNHSLQYQKYGM